MGRGAGWPGADSAPPRPRRKRTTQNPQPPSSLESDDDGLDENDRALAAAWVPWRPVVGAASWMGFATTAFGARALGMRRTANMRTGLWTLTWPATLTCQTKVLCSMLLLLHRGSVRPVHLAPRLCVRQDRYAKTCHLVAVGSARLCDPPL